MAPPIRTSVRCVSLVVFSTMALAAYQYRVTVGARGQPDPEKSNSVLLCDINGDEYLDVIYTGFGLTDGGGPFLYVGTQQGLLWTINAQFPPLQGGLLNKGLVCGDFNFDGKNDLAVNGETAFGILLQRSGSSSGFALDAYLANNSLPLGPTVTALIQPTSPAGLRGKSTAVFFLTDDPFPDFFVTSDTRTEYVFMNNTSSYDYDQNYFPPPGSGIRNDYLCTGDFDSNRMTDVYLRTDAISTGSYRQQPQGSLSTSLNAVTSTINGAVTLCDFTNTGLFTLVNSAGTDSDNLPLVLYQFGAGVQQPNLNSKVANNDGSGYAFARDLWCEDFDNNGWLDLLVILDMSAVIWKNSAQGFVSAPIAIPYLNSVGAVGDVTGDGVLDIVSMNDTGVYLWVDPMLAPYPRSALFINVSHRHPLDARNRSQTFGARINVRAFNDTANMVSAARFISGGNGHGSQTPLPMHFGLTVENQTLLVTVQPPEAVQAGAEDFLVFSNSWSSFARRVADFTLGGCLSGDNSCCTGPKPYPLASCNSLGQWMVNPTDSTVIFVNETITTVWVNANVSVMGTTTFDMTDGGVPLVLSGCLSPTGALVVNLDNVSLFTGDTEITLIEYGALCDNAMEFESVLFQQNGRQCKTKETPAYGSNSMSILVEKSDCSQQSSDNTVAIAVGVASSAVVICCLCGVICGVCIGSGMMGLCTCISAALARHSRKNLTMLSKVNFDGLEDVPAESTWF